MSNFSREAIYYRPSTVEHNPHPEDPKLAIDFLGQRVELWKFIPKNRKVTSLSDLAYAIADSLKLSANQHDAVHGIDNALRDAGLTATWLDGAYYIHAAHLKNFTPNNENPTAKSSSKRRFISPETPPLFISPEKPEESEPDQEQKKLRWRVI